MKSQFNKTMNVVDVLFLAIGAMLGWGWVVLSGEWVSTAGFVGSIIAFVIGGILVIVIGLTYAELASAIPKQGWLCICKEGIFTGYCIYFRLVCTIWLCFSDYI